MGTPCSIDSTKNKKEDTNVETNNALLAGGYDSSKTLDLNTTKKTLVTEKVHE